MKLLIIDDEKNMRHMLKAMLGRHGYDIDCVADGAEGLKRINQESYEFILCDIRMPGIDGLEFLDQAKSHIKNSTVIMMSAYGSLDLAITAMKKGAYDFISKPFKADEVILALKKAEERERLKKENQFLKKELAKIKGGATFGRMIGESRVMKSFWELAKKTSGYDAALLVTGETGTGKEMVAKGVHLNSSRASGKFVAINCGAIPENLLESELFGYSKGAFTGADSSKKGLIETAEGGTLFLDEIGELPASMQIKLLRFLQEGEIRPIGATDIISVNIRIITATSSDLEELVMKGEFRQDLYFRINILRLHVPALRERKDDIPLLCSYLIKKFSAKMDCDPCTFEPDALVRLMKYDFPGNVRELENIIQRSLVIADNALIKASDLPLYAIGKKVHTDKFDFGTPSLKIAQKHLEKKMILKVMIETNGNKTKAARMLEISYPSLLNKIKEYKIGQDN